MQAFKLVSLCVLVLCQRAWSAPADSDSDKVTADFNKNLGEVIQHLQDGASSLARPELKFAIDVIPNLSVNAVKTAADKAGVLADAGRNAFQNAFKGLSNLREGTTKFGSSIVNGITGNVKQGVTAATGVAGTGFNAGIHFFGELMDAIANTTKVGGDIIQAGMNAGADGLSVASAGATIGFNAISNVIAAVQLRIQQIINSIESLAAKIVGTGSTGAQNGALAVTAGTQRAFYSMLNIFLQVLNTFGTTMDKFLASVVASTTASGTTGGTTTTS